MGLATALDLLVARVEGFSPTRDPKVRFRRVDEVFAGAYRQFIVLDEVAIAPNDETRPNPYASTVTLEFFYDRRTERYRQLKDVASDAEEIFDRVVYSNSDQWGLASGLGIIFESIDIRGEEKALVISLVLKLIYNV